MPVYYQDFALQAEVASIWSTIFGSTYMDWLAEYGSTGDGGTNQAISRGSVATALTMYGALVHSPVTLVWLLGGVTDPYGPGSAAAPAWANAGGGDIASICSGTSPSSLGGYLVATGWSNAAATCR